MKIAVSSDWHGQPPTRKDQGVIRGCDALLLAGDILENNAHYKYRVVDPLARFLIQLKDNGVPVIMTPGNHDFHIYNGWLNSNPKIQDEIDQMIEPRLLYGKMKVPLPIDLLEEFLGIRILIDQQYDLNGIKIFGSPWSPEFCGWAFMLEDKDLLPKFQSIPMDADILIAHGPPWIEGERLDMVEGEDRHCGSKSLAKVLSERPNLKYGFFGHIHTGSHTPVQFGSTVLQNVSYLNEDYNTAYPITVIEV